jgi:L-lactate dehydrogenase complex protein LldF
MTGGPAVGFVERASAAVADAKLRAALALAIGRLSAGRTQAFAAFPEGDRLRDHARHIRAHTLARLDDYLARFVAAATRAGAQVHCAETAEEATACVVELARSRGVRSVVKSKSMVSEEVALNEGLEAAGIRVVETDLGEFIVQLAGDRPSHIIAPVAHRSRADIAALFKETLGATDAEVADIPSMTALARRVLRREFLDAGMGVSGANFGVAETGSLVTVTNEGNGRLVTTAPPIHVALVGIERIVPTVEDLGVMLQLLARSATGQQLSVYTNVVTGPRRGPRLDLQARAQPGGSSTERGLESGAESEPDGPDELHIVLVDNGRSRLLGTELAEILYCIRCGACLNACPVYREIGGHTYDGVYGGPVGSVFTPAKDGVRLHHDLPHASTLCGACRDVCPVRIDLPRLLLALRAHPENRATAPRWLRAGIRAYRTMAVRPHLYRAAARVARAWGRRMAGDGWISRLPGPLGAWTESRDFPAPASSSFVEEWRKRQRRAS